MEELWCYCVEIFVPYEDHTVVRFYPGYNPGDALNCAMREFPELDSSHFVVTSAFQTWEDFIRSV